MEHEFEIRRDDVHSSKHRQHHSSFAVYDASAVHTVTVSCDRLLQPTASSAALQILCRDGICDNLKIAAARGNMLAPVPGSGDVALFAV
jgi:hypothetical protein